MTLANNAFFYKKNFPTHWDIPIDISGRILVGGFHNAQDECYYVIDFAKRTLECCIVDVTTYAKQMSVYLRKQLELHQLPYGSSSHESAVYNFLQPHEGLELKNGLIAMAMHNASYTRLINFEQKYVSAFSSENTFIPEMVSATNSLDKSGDNLFYSISDMNHRMEMYRSERSDISTQVYRASVSLEHYELLQELKTTEVIHEVKFCPNQKNILLTEFCLTAKSKLPPRHEQVFACHDEWSTYQENGLYTSPIYLLDINKKCHTKINVNSKTPGHVEFLKSEPNSFWLSCHNLSKGYGKLILHGPGELIKGEIHDGKISIKESYSNEFFYRVTSHKIYNYDSKEYIVATVFPNKFYIFETNPFSVVKNVQLYEHEAIENGKLHFCTLLEHMPIWIETSDDGRYVILVSNNSIYIYDMKTSKLFDCDGWSFKNNFVGTAHITNMNDFHMHSN